jgi:hypothetical protein
MPITNKINTKLARDYLRYRKTKIKITGNRTNLEKSLISILKNPAKP